MDRFAGGWVAALALVVQHGVAMGQGADASTAERASSGTGPEAPTDAAPQRSWDAAIGAVAVYGPAFTGSDRQALRLSPGFYIRYGRLSFATRGGFRTASEPGERGGMRLDLSPSERLRINVGLRYDAGRQESSSEELRGLGDVPSTLRVRTSMNYKLADGWSVGSTSIFDVLGRGGGWQADLHGGREWRLTETTRANAGMSLAYAGDRHMQTYFGITEEQSARSVYPVFDAPAGWRDATVAISARTELTDWGGAWQRWHVFYGASATRLLGAAAASPLTKQRNAWSANAGLAYRF